MLKSMQSLKKIVKNDHYKDINKDALQQQINMLITEKKNSQQN